MSLVVEHHDLLRVLAGGPQVAQHPTHHRLRGLLERVVGTVTPKQQTRIACDVADLLGVLELKSVKVRDHDAGLLQAALDVCRDQIAQVVVVLGILWQQDAQPVPDGDARRDDQEAVGKACVPRRLRLIQCLLGDQHCHHHGLARAGRHLLRNSGQAGIVRVVVRRESLTPIGHTHPCGRRPW